MINVPKGGLFLDGEKIFCVIVMVLSCWGCAGLFCGIGYWAKKRKDPMHFYSGSTVDPKSISDIPAYNRANSRMWMTYSIPFWLCGFFSIAGLWASWCGVVSVVLLCVGSIAGSVWLVLRYQKIRRKFAADDAN